MSLDGNTIEFLYMLNFLLFLQIEVDSQAGKVFSKAIRLLWTVRIVMSAFVTIEAWHAVIQWLITDTKWRK